MPKHRRRSDTWSTTRQCTVTRADYYEEKRLLDLAKAAKLPTLQLEDMDYPRVDPVAQSNLAWSYFPDL